jgi:uncharacterized protein
MNDRSPPVAPPVVTAVSSPALQEPCGDFDLRIGSDGTWYYGGSAIQRPALVRLFASVLRRDGDEYWLITPVERGRIVVDDAPFIAVSVTISGHPSDADARLTFTTNVDETVVAGPDHPIRVAHSSVTGEPRPYIMVRDGLEALIARSVYYELANRAATGIDAAGQERYGVWSQGRFFPLD